MCLAEGFLSLSLVLIECFLIMVCSGEAVYSVALATLVEWAGGGWLYSADSFLLASTHQAMKKLLQYIQTVPTLHLCEMIFGVTILPRIFNVMHTS